MDRSAESLFLAVFFAFFAGITALNMLVWCVLEDATRTTRSPRPELSRWCPSMKNATSGCTRWSGR